MNYRTRKALGLLGTWAFALFGLVLLSAAGFHRLQLDLADPARYTTSPLMPLEMMLMPVMGIGLLANLARGIYLFLKKLWLDLAMVAASTLVGIVCMVVAMQVDMPTLMYMT